MSVKLSVLVTIYNAEEYLEECITSLLSQSLDEIEILCINDGSTDSTEEILARFKEKDPRIVVVNKSNSGYGHNINLGMSMAQGEYVAIVDSDDYCDPIMYESLYEIAKAEQLDFVKCDFSRFWDIEGGRKFEYASLCPDSSWYDKVFDPSSDPKYLDIYLLSQPGIYSRDFLMRNNVVLNETPGASYQDNGFWIQVFTQAKRAYVSKGDFYKLRRDNPNSSIHDKGKVYCMCDESQFILDFFDRHPAIKERFISKFMVSRFNNYMFTLNRIDIRFKQEFLQRFASDFEKAANEGDLEKSLFTEHAWNTLLLIMDNPDEYFFRQYIEIPLGEAAEAVHRADSIENSTTWKVGRALTAIPRFLKKKIKG